MKNKKLKIKLLILIPLIILFGFFITITIVSMTEKNAKQEWNSTFEKIRIIGTYTIDGEEKPITTEMNIYASDIHEVKINGHFTSVIEKNEKIMFKINNLKVLIKINNKIVYDNTDESEYSNDSKSQGKIWQSFSSPGIERTDDVYIELTNVYENTLETPFKIFFDSFYYGSEYGLFDKLIHESNFDTYLSLFVLFLGITVIVIGLLLYIVRVKDLEKVLALGLLSFVTGFWLYWNTYFGSELLLISFPKLPEFFDNAGVFLFPVVMQVYIYCFTTNKNKIKILHSIYITFVIALFVLIMELFHIFSLVQFKPFGIVNIMIIVLFNIYVTIDDIKRTKEKSSILVMLFFIPTFLGIFLDAIFYFTKTNLNNGCFRYGFVLTMIFQLAYVIKYVQDKNHLIKKMDNIEGEVLQNQIAIMLSQIRPHFMFNSLNAISALCTINPEKADSSIIAFANYLRTNLSSIGKKSLVHFEVELNYIENYIYLEKLRFEEKLNMVYEIEYNDFLIPSLSIQPLIENAIKHGIFDKDGIGTIILKTYRKNDYIYIQVIDDGVGFDPETIDGKTNSIGIENVSYRLQLLCNANLSIKSKPNKGTCITIELPIKGE